MTGPDIPSGCLDGKVHRFAVRVYYEDTDLFGHGLSRQLPALVRARTV
jgi:acyl-CoA thioesterase FadM